MDSASPHLPDDETVQVHCRCLAITPVVGKGRLLALAEVEIEISGFSIQVNGVRVEREAAGVSVRLPVDYAKRTLVSDDEPVRSSVLADVVLAAGLEIGILKERP